MSDQNKEDKIKLSVENDKKRSKSAETQRDRIHRAAKKVLNYKETKTYNKNLVIPACKNSDVAGSAITPEIEDSSCSAFKSSNLTARSPTKNINLVNPFQSPPDEFDIEKKNIRKQNPELTDDDSEKENENLTPKKKPHDILLKDFLNPHLVSPSNNERLLLKISTQSNENSEQETQLNISNSPTDPPSNLFSLQNISKSDPILRIKSHKMATLNEQTYKILKKCPNISVDDSKHETRENVEKIRSLSRQIPEEDIKGFIEAIKSNFDCEIREAIENEKGLDTVDKICDFVIQKFLLKGNFDQKLKELGEMKKKKSETYGDFGRRLTKFKNDLVKIGGYKSSPELTLGRKTVAEGLALNTYIKGLKKYLAMVHKFGIPKTVEEAQKYVEMAEMEINFSDEEVEEEVIPKKTVNMLKSRKLPTCQQCDNASHEAFFCPVSACLYCGSNMHKSAECSDSDAKIKVICKECHTVGHTIDRCPKKSEEDHFCQICQEANAHTAKNCGVGSKLMKKIETLTDSVNTLNISPANRGQIGHQRPGNLGCHICGDTNHFMRNCPQSLPFGYRQVRREERRSRGGLPHHQSGGFGRSYQPRSGPPNQQQYAPRTFSRGNRSNPRGYQRGGNRSYPPNWNNPFYSYPRYPSNFQQNNPFLDPRMQLGGQYWQQMPMPIISPQRVGQPVPAQITAAPVQTVQYAQSENGTPLM